MASLIAAQAAHAPPPLPALVVQHAARGGGGTPGRPHMPAPPVPRFLPSPWLADDKGETVPLSNDDSDIETQARGRRLLLPLSLGQW